MEVKEAVATAKAYLRDILADEQIRDVGLEEVEFDDERGEWRVTLGFSRPWSQPRLSPLEVAIDPLARIKERPSRDYRVVSIDDSDGQVRSMKLHELAA